MDLIRTEGPALLGYAAVLVGLAVFVLITYLSSSDVIERRRRNSIVRHARAGCSVCLVRLHAEAARR